MAKLHFLLFPFMAKGHTIPTLDMAKLFASHGIKITILTTQSYASPIMEAIHKTDHLGYDINTRIIKFPAAEAGLPEGCDSLDQATSNDSYSKFYQASALLQTPLEHILQELSPDCLVADMFFPWATDAAAKFDIPRLVFHGISYFALCALEMMRTHKPFKNVSSDSEPFLIPHLPDEIKFTRSQLAVYDRDENETEFAKLLKQVKDSERESYGVIVNSFYELEPDYADYYRNVLGRRAWNVGPLFLPNRVAEVNPGHEEHDCLKWLNTKQRNSVIYVCFGSMSNFTNSQFHEIAFGLESSGKNFIWVVRNDNGNVLPEGFENQIKEKGLVIRGWAPQVKILEHESISAFITHCGWNSTLEGVCAGVPMVTWPLFAEQFYNEKLVTQVLKIGVAVGSQQWSRVGDGVSKEDVARAVKSVMDGDEAVEMRKRAKALKVMAREAIEENGSSYNDLNALIQELNGYDDCQVKKSNGH